MNDPTARTEQPRNLLHGVTLEAIVCALEAHYGWEELARELIAARTQAGLTQGDVAARMGTTQSAVARIESSRGTPSMRTVQRFANAVGARAVVRMALVTDELFIRTQSDRSNLDSCP